jgi:flagellar biosynthetic protein FlhB
MAEDNRTEPATPRKRQRAREKGQVARSTELVHAVSLFLVFGTIQLSQGFMGKTIQAFARHMFDVAGEYPLDVSSVMGLVKISVTATLLVMMPVLAVAVLAGFLSSVIQVGFVFATDPISPHLDRLNPVSGFKRLFSMRAMFDTAKNLLKLVIIALIVYGILRSEAAGLINLSDMSASDAFMYVFHIALRIGLTTSAVLLILAIFDLAYQRWEFEKTIKMTKQEVKDEMREQEGDPHIRRRVREFGRAIAFRRMMQKVKDADVVVTNPTEYAVALLYEVEFGAPRVVAKGRGYMAERIKREAQKWDIPIYEDRLLARALYKVEIDQVIPPKLFQAVAQVLAFLSRVDMRMRAKLSSLRA